MSLDILLPILLDYTALGGPAAQASNPPGTDANTNRLAISAAPAAGAALGVLTAQAAQHTAAQSVPKTPVVNTDAPADEQEPVTQERVYAGGYTQSQANDMAAELRQIRRDLEFAKRQWTAAADGKTMEGFSTIDEAAAEIQRLEKRQRELEKILAAISADHQLQIRLDEFVRLASTDDAPRSETEGRAAQRAYDTVNREMDYYISGNAPIGYQFQYTMEEAQEKKEFLQKLYGNLTSMTAQERNAYMTEEQQRIYYTLLGKYGGEKAMEYYYFIRDELTQRQGQAEAEKILAEENGFLRGVKGTLYSLESGLEGTVINAGQHLVGGNAPTPASAYGTEALAENSSKAAGYVYKAAQGVGQALPAIALAYLTGDVNMMRLANGVTATGAAYAKAKQEGRTEGQARLYSALVGSVDVALDKLMGGLGKFTGITEAALLDRASALKNVFTRTAASFAIREGSEALEGALQQLLEPAIEAILFDEKYDVPDFETLAENAITDLLSNLVLEDWSTEGNVGKIDKDSTNAYNDSDGNPSGALNRDSKRANEHAEQYYESVRKMTNDVKRIAENTGFSESDISYIKNYLFMDEHDLGDYGVKKFDASYEIGQSWQRLIDGKQIQPHDITLLHHEVMERNLVEKGYSQDEAHKMTSSKYNYKREADVYYDKNP